MQKRPKNKSITLNQFWSTCLQSKLLARCCDHVSNQKKLPGILSRTLRLTNYHTDHINHAPSLFGTWVNFLRLSLTPLLYIFCIYLLPLPLTHRPILPFQKPRSHNEIILILPLVPPMITQGMAEGLSPVNENGSKVKWHTHFYQHGIVRGIWLISFIFDRDLFICRERNLAKQDNAK